MTADITNTPTYAIGRVDFLVGTGVVCSDTTADAAGNYTCTWKAPAATKTYQVQAKAYDTSNNVGTSNVVSVQVK